jgi:hypothetical protein
VATKVTAEDRKKTGIKGTGKYPTATHKQRMSAVKLRSNGKGVGKTTVLAHVAAAAERSGDKAAKNAVNKARAKDKGKGK